MNKKKGILFLTLGCRLNQAESTNLRKQALEKGFQTTSSEKGADIFIINSCSVTDKAQRDTEKTLKKLKEKYLEKTIVITGCGARNEHKKYAVVVKNNEKRNLFYHLERSEIESRDLLENEGNTIRERDFSAPHSRKSVEMTDKISSRTRLMVKVQDGCNNFCSYCIVPYLRGREKSRDVTDILKELHSAEKLGFKEIVLTGVNVGRYSGSNLQSKKNSLPDLIRKILKETSFPRIRLSSINPDDFSDDLIDLWATEPRLCPHFHISLQSGSDNVLRRMKRQYTIKEYSALTAKLRKKIPDVQISTDIIVGFPGETEEEFAETIQFVNKMQFLKVHVFRYSSREGTRASKMSGQVSEKIKKDRAVKLQKLESDIRDKILQKYIGKEMDVLFEQARLSSSGLTRGSIYSGYSPNYIKVLKKSKKNLENKIVKTRIRDCRDYLLG